MWENPDRAATSTSHVERNNLSVRMPATHDAVDQCIFEEDGERCPLGMALYFLYYNFVRIHKTLSDVAR